MKKNIWKWISMLLVLAMLAAVPGFATMEPEQPIETALPESSDAPAAPEATEAPESTAEPAPSEEPAPAESAAPDESTEHEVSTDNKMFKIVRSVLTLKDGAYTAQITLSGTGYDKLYLGSAEQAAADSANWIAYSGTYEYTNADGEAKTGYTFTIPVSAVNEPIPVAAYSGSKETWYDRNITFTVATEEPTPEPTQTPAPTPAPTPVVLDTPGKVNSSTTLADGDYAPDKFSWSGGSGRTSVSCSKVSVRDGKAYATISFSSDSYAYVKASGSKYYGSVVGGRSTFEIPVKLNANNKIVGMTTAMSADHEIAYTIYVYIAAAEDAPESAEAKQAEITGLKFESADELESAGLFKIYRYEDGFAAIDVADVGKYLVAPQDAELPVGIEEEVCVVRQPVLSVYAASEGALEMIDALALEDAPLKTAGLESFAYVNTDPESVAYAGGYDAPDYAALLKTACDLAVMPESFADADLPAALADVQNRLAMLGIPMFVDRSADEASEAGRIEWIKVYGVLLGCEEAANACYASVMAGLEG